MIAILAWRDLDDPEAGRLGGARVAGRGALGPRPASRSRCARRTRPGTRRWLARRLPRDPQGRPLPRVPARRVQRDDGLARRERRARRDLERHAVLLAGVGAPAARRVAAPRARHDVGDDAAAAARAARPHARVPRRAADLPRARRSSRCRSRRRTRSSRKLHLRRSDITVVPPGIDPSFSPGRTRVGPTPLVVAVGRLVPVKRFDLLIDALGDGQGRASPTLRGGHRRRGLRARRARARRSPSSAPSAGSRCPVASTTPTLLDLYRRAWVLASASAHEGWGMTITEAAACGTPAVATRIAGHADAIVDGATGLLVDDRDGARPRRSTACSRDDRAARPARDRRALEHAAALHVGRDGARHARGPRGRGARAARHGVTHAARASADHGPASRSAAYHGRRDRLRLLALLAYVPPLLTAPGKVAADTKQYLYLDPGRLLCRRGLDVGPEHRHGHGHPPEHRVPVPDGPVLLAPRQARRPRLGRAAAVARLAAVRRRRSACCTCCARSACAARASSSPRSRTCSRRTSLDYAARISVLLMPWAALPWMIARHPQGAAATAGGGIPAIFALDRAGRRRRERDRADLRRRRAGAVDPVRVARRRARSTGGRALGVDGAHRRRSRSLTSLWWIAGLAHAGQLRARHPEVHRDGRRRSRARRRRTRSCAASATGSSTARTGSGRGSRPRATTRSTRA